MRGRPVLGAIAGLFLGVFLAFDLVLLKAVPSDSTMIVLLPIAGVVAGILLGRAAPLGRKGR